MVLGALLAGCAAENDPLLVGGDDAQKLDDAVLIADAGATPDVGSDAADVPAVDAGAADAAGADGATMDATSRDAGATDATALDGGAADASNDAAAADRGSVDVGIVDAGGTDAAALDAARDGGPADAGVDASTAAFGAAVEVLASAGGTGGSPYDDDCPAGSAMVGFDGVVSGYLTHVAVACAALRVEGLRVRTGTVTLLPVRGLNPGTDVSLRCPADQLVVGFEGRSGSLVDQLSLACAPYAVGVVGSALVAQRGAVTLTTSAGGTGGNPFARVACSGDAAARGAAIHAGDGIDAFALRCSSLAVR